MYDKEMRKQVVAWRKAVGLSQSDPKLHVKLLQEECMERAVATVDYLDSVLDAYVIAVGYTEDIGSDHAKIVEEELELILQDVSVAEDAFKVVMASLQSKLVSRSEVNKVVEQMVSQGHKVVAQNISTSPYWGIYASRDYTLGGKFTPEGKLVKPTTFKEPDWYELMQHYYEAYCKEIGVNP